MNAKISMFIICVEVTIYDDDDDDDDAAADDDDDDDGLFLWYG